MSSVPLWIQAIRREAENLRGLGNSVDRIVLFIDDLDRCQPAKVVDVLQAVHLLLAFPLFAVVVGVDQRCLRQSLRSEFGGVLSSPSIPSLADDHSTILEAERPPTPLDYLEKIFHVPFHLPTMEVTLAYSALVMKLTEPAVASPEPNSIGPTLPGRTEGHSGFLKIQ